MKIQIPRATIDMFRLFGITGWLPARIRPSVTMSEPVYNLFGSTVGHTVSCFLFSFYLEDFC